MSVKEVNLYKLSSSQWEKAFPKLIESIYKKNLTVCVYCANDNDIEKTDALLWTYEQLSFLPHITYKDEKSASAPILVTNKPSSQFAQILALTSSELPENYKDFSKILVMFNQQNEGEFTALQDHLKSEDYQLNTFLQTKEGWSKSA